jgi:hypothetical protein
MDTSTLTAAARVAIAVSLVKPYVEARMPKGWSLHDATIRLLAIAMGIAAAVADYLNHTAHVSGPGVQNALGSGLAAGLGAILYYHIVSGNLFDQPRQPPTA